MTYVHVVLHIASVVASLAAGFLWMRSAAVKVPAIAPSEESDAIQKGEVARWAHEMAKNLDRHRNGLILATKYNMAAAAAASIAALAQAAVFALNVADDLIRL
ncbi:hypothetical protein GCM10019059_26750 [Camelimonas fluminis]|uniref:Uncharacterized protein n=1 Tax=Camelimonas fluminis TaxID=1576911 RepID=A0ABV7UMX0_9HYPH|nr:hypothetical protein [Camelimonas fluminis]GHE65614.1 hypothetical protein GCM10019059_26750 [Camelimonas fluminis]